MEFYPEEKWRPLKDEPNTSPVSSLMRSISQKGSSKSPLPRTFSMKNHKPPLSRCSSTKSTSSKFGLSRSSSQKCSEFAKKCSNLAKEQRARFYIMKRCVKMLVSWRKDNDS